MTDEQRRQAAVEVLRMQRYQMRIDNLKKQQAELQKEQETLKKKLTSLEKESRQSQKKSLDILYGELHIPRRVLKTLTLEGGRNAVPIKDLDIRYR
ncbi:hypothetical protein [Methanovulcanius yangii]|uniref:hypothetical protein n=1 Tax=Methanovulcanius yangii TaxID=1789227 RepID=UPI0029C9F171|nr:hypothetical protein [Methanovulcanius yangii]